MAVVVDAPVTIDFDGVILEVGDFWKRIEFFLWQAVAGLFSGGFVNLAVDLVTPEKGPAVKIFQVMACLFFKKWNEAVLEEFYESFYFSFFLGTADTG